jgi:hypothetical protein
MLTSGAADKAADVVFVHGFLVLGASGVNRARSEARSFYMERVPA